MFLVHAAIARPDIAISLHLATGLAVLVCFFLMYSAGWLGAGDVKLLASVSVWAGPFTVLPLLVTVSIAGAGLALIALLQAVRNEPESKRRVIGAAMAA
jgi:prepilin peptidase CpaA